MKTLCVYCTRTGLTKQIAGIIAERTGAELLAITDGKDRSGFFGYVGAAAAGLRRRLPALAPFETALPLGEYDRVILAAPVWSENVCPIARAFLKQHGGALTGSVCYVLTHMSPAGYEKKLAALDALLGRAPEACLSVRTKDHGWAADAEAFAARLAERK